MLFVDNWNGKRRWKWSGKYKNLMRNVQAMASVTRPCENTSTGMYSTRSRASTAPATRDTEDSLRRENIEHDEQSLNEYVKVCLEKLLKGLHDMRKEMDTFKRDIQRAVNFQGEEIKRTFKRHWASQNCDQKYKFWKRTDQTICRKDSCWSNNLKRYSRRNNIRLVGYPETRGENTREIVDTILTLVLLGGLYQPP